MWTAVALVRPLDVDIDEELKNKTYDQLTDEQKKGYKTITHKIYTLGTNNLSTIDNIQNPNQSLDDTSKINYSVFPRELGEKQIGDVTIPGNKFLKPQAGITGLSSETGGTLGSIKTTEISLFYAEGRTVFLINNAKRKYILDYKLESLEEVLNSSEFFRVNRTFIINISDIQDVLVYSNSRLKITSKVFNEKEIIVSREKVNAFKAWFEGN